MKDGQKFGWEEDDEPDDLVPETEPPEDARITPVEQAADSVTPESMETAQESGEPAASEENVEGAELAKSPEEEQSEEEEEGPPEFQERTPRGQEVRTAHGKLELKIVPMMANEQEDMDAIIFDTEVDVGRARGCSHGSRRRLKLAARLLMKARSASWRGRT